MPKSDKKEEMILQSAVIPYFFLNDKLKIVLVSTASKFWVIPKGNISKGLSPADSAAREALEEAGVSGIVEQDEIDHYFYKKDGRSYMVNIYLLKVTKIHDKWDEQNWRKRKFLSVNKACERLHTVDVINLLRQLPEKLKQN